MLSLIAGAILFFCSAYIGLTVKKHYKKRSRFFKDTTEFLRLLESEISYLKTPLKKIIDLFCAERKGELVKLLTRYRGLIDEGACINSPTLSENFDLKFLKPDEKECVLSFFSALGKSDYATELKNLSNFAARFETFSEASEKTYSTTGTLAFKLSVLLGIALMIIVA